jgi:nicotinamide phosphoribosyltransferase
MRLRAVNAIDFYKADHRRQYPDGTQAVYSNLTPRSGKLSNLPPGFQDGVVFFGLQHLIKSYLIDGWNETFFKQPKEKVVAAYKRRMDTSLGGNFDVQHIADLHDLGYLPIAIRALPEGTVVPYGVPCMTIRETEDKFFWLTNYLETVLSNLLWKPCTSATTARFYNRLFTSAAIETGGPVDFVPWQAHDFSFRGMAGIEDACISGAAHLTSFYGTDTVPAIDLVEDYYGANADIEIVGGSVAATEHSVMCMGGHDDEFGTFKRLITEVYPSGIVSIVSDTWDFWQVVTDFLPRLKTEIMARDGKVVIRPDSGDPVQILCGDPEAPIHSAEHYGLIECLWRTFGGTTTDKGYKQLDSHIGAIYGDSITPARALEIVRRLKAKGFASTNVVLGVGSFTYEYVTRDTHGFAMKATWGVVKGRERDIQKNPKTDSGSKKSHKGLLAVHRNPETGELYVKQGVSLVESYMGEMRAVFTDGDLFNEQNFATVRDTVKAGLKLDKTRKLLFS